MLAAHLRYCWKWLGLLCGSELVIASKAAWRYLLEGHTPGCSLALGFGHAGLFTARRSLSALRPCLREAVGTPAIPAEYFLLASFCIPLSQSMPSNSLLFSILESDVHVYVCE